MLGRQEFLNSDDNKERTKRKGLEGGAVVVLFQCVLYKVKERQEEE